MLPLNPRRREHRARRTPLGALSLATVCVLLATPVTPAGATTAVPGSPDAHCAGRALLRVPGAARQQADCLDELTTAGTVASGHTDPADYAGLTPKDLPTPTGVPGIQVDGYFPDTSTTNTDHGWHHDSQFVIRLPDRWNGGLVVAGTPGNREQYAGDRAIADWVLARGYAYAATDKGNTGTAFFRDGRRPGDAIAEWNTRLTQLTRAARTVVAQRYHRPPARTLATGLSNGGYLVRWQLENHPELYDGGVDWEGTLWRADGPNPLTFLPAALRHYPDHAAGGPRAAEATAAMHRAGYPAGSEFLWPYHHQVYWDLTQRIYREEFDPGYDGATEAGTPYCASGTPGCDADYAYPARPAAVHRAVARIALTGRIGKPLITLQGTLDVLLPISRDSDVYARMVHAAGRGSLLRYYRIEDGTHTDSLADVFPDRLRPMVPCHRAAFTALERWIAGAGLPPADHTVARPAGADPATLLTSCPLGQGLSPGRPQVTWRGTGTYHGRMSFLRRRSATPAGPDFDVLAMDPGDWPGNLGAGLLPAPDGTCQGVFLRYDLFGGRGPAMIIGNLPEGSPAREVAEGEIPFEVGQLLLALENDEEVTVVGTEDTPVLQGDNLLIVRRLKLSESRISCVQFDRSDGVLVTIAAWDRPITDDLYALLKPLPAELFQQG